MGFLANGIGLRQSTRAPTRFFRRKNPRAETRLTTRVYRIYVALSCFGEIQSRNFYYSKAAPTFYFVQIDITAHA